MLGSLLFARVTRVTRSNTMILNLVLLLWCTLVLLIHCQEQDNKDLLPQYDFSSTPLNLLPIHDNQQLSGPSTEIILSNATQLQIGNNQIINVDLEEGQQQQLQEQVDQMGVVLNGNGSEPEIAELLFSVVDFSENGSSSNQDVNQVAQNSEVVREFKSVQPKLANKVQQESPQNEVDGGETMGESSNSSEVYQKYFEYMRNFTGGFTAPTFERSFPKITLDDVAVDSTYIIAGEYPKCSNVLDVIRHFNNKCRNKVVDSSQCLQELESIIETAGSVDSLSNPQLSITLFAPSDAAFNKQGLFRNRAPQIQESRELLMFHSVPHSLKLPLSDETTVMAIPQLIGAGGLFSPFSDLNLNSTHVTLWDTTARIVQPDIPACNSYVNIIDNLLYPSEEDLANANLFQPKPAQDSTPSLNPVSYLAPINPMPDLTPFISLPQTPGLPQQQQTITLIIPLPPPPPPSPAPSPSPTPVMNISFDQLYRSLAVYLQGPSSVNETSDESQSLQVDIGNAIAVNGHTSTPDPNPAPAPTPIAANSSPPTAALEPVVTQQSQTYVQSYDSYEIPIGLITQLLQDQNLIYYSNGQSGGDATNINLNISQIQNIQQIGRNANVVVNSSSIVYSNSTQQDFSAVNQTQADVFVNSSSIVYSNSTEQDISVVNQTQFVVSLETLTRLEDQMDLDDQIDLEEISPTYEDDDDY